jgi:serine/threonine protein kinase
VSSSNVKSTLLSAYLIHPYQPTLHIGDSIFIDDEENIRLGDFGLATSNRPSSKPHGELEAYSLYDAIDDISGLLGATSSSSANRAHNAISITSITGGVGTALYMAPEQEFSKSLKGKPSYDSKADMFSLGVLLFEMFMLKVCHFIQECKTITCLSFVQAN